MDIAFLTTSLDRGRRRDPAGAHRHHPAPARLGVGILTMMPSDGPEGGRWTRRNPLAECLDARARIPWRIALCACTGSCAGGDPRSWSPSISPPTSSAESAAGWPGCPTIVSAVGTTHIKTSLRRRFYRFTEPLIARTVANSKAAAWP